MIDEPVAKLLELPSTVRVLGQPRLEASKLRTKTFTPWYFCPVTKLTGSPSLATFRRKIRVFLMVARGGEQSKARRTCRAGFVARIEV